MDTAVKTRPNHYEVLGLTPDATGEEIARAFAREVSMFRPHAFGGVAEAGVAYAVLRDPARRRAYDDKLGFNQPPPAPPPEPEPAAEAAGAMAPFAAHHMRALARPKPSAEPRTAAFIASALREPVPPSVRQEPQPDVPRAPKLPPVGITRAPEREDRPIEWKRPLSISPSPEPEEPAIDWRRPAVAAGGVVAAVALIGAWAGWDAGNAIEQEQPKRAVTVALPKANAVAATAADAPQRNIFAKPQRRSHSARVQRVPISRQPLTVAEEATPIPPPPVEANPPEQDAVAEATPAPAAVAASMPLSNSAIARTIGRIGYPCGRVASTSQVLGKVFKVTCTSGDSYRAAPIHGRYRFKRL